MKYARNDNRMAEFSLFIAETRVLAVGKSVLHWSVLRIETEQSAENVPVADAELNVKAERIASSRAVEQLFIQCTYPQTASLCEARSLQTVTIRLPEQLQAELEFSRWADRRDLAEVGIRHVAVWIQELRMIECVERIGAKLKIH